MGCSLASEAFGFVSGECRGSDLEAGTDGLSSQVLIPFQDYSHDIHFSEINIFFNSTFKRKTLKNSSNDLVCFQESGCTRPAKGSDSLAFSHQHVEVGVSQADSSLGVWPAAA